ncbi:MerR family transcriptional regulator [Microbacterium halophytorum]|uniref:MerR family transcriptional regulator n=1 Tax=Microbacterium halophytorum TaxID=2067568 RepID=UPI000CFB86EA|nr:MerR family transcriptional regulator [Microbacterium halophytorum]
MLRIGDFARLVGVSVRMLRHYDQLGLLKPARIDEFTGYRSYEAAQLDRANHLIAMKELGFTLDEVGELLRDELGDDRVIEMLRERENSLTSQIDADQRRLRRVRARLRSLEKGSTMPTNTFTETSLPAVRLVQLAASASSMEEIEPWIGPMFGRVNQAIDDEGLVRTGPGIAHYTVTEAGVLAAVGEQVGDSAPPEGLEATELASAPRALAMTYEGGGIDGIQAAWQSLVIEVEARGLTPTGVCREVYHETPLDPDGEKWVIELQQPIE